MQQSDAQNVSLRSAFCFDRLFLTTYYAFLIFFLSRNMFPLSFFYSYSLFSFSLLRPDTNGVLGSTSPSSSYPFALSLSLCVLLDTVYKPQPTPSSGRTFFESYCTMRFEWGGREERAAPLSFTNGGRFYSDLMYRCYLPRNENRIKALCAL